MMSPIGTFETCRQALRMSGVGGRPEVEWSAVKVTRLTQLGHRSARGSSPPLAKCFVDFVLRASLRSRIV
jgi:hypothetical protein